MRAQFLLLVEDEALIRLDLVQVLEDRGYVVADYADGPPAMAEVDRRDEISGLITDINLGSDVDGWEVARHTRTKFPGIPVVYISGDSVANWPDEGVPNSLILQKPFADNEIVSALSTLLGEGTAASRPSAG